MIFKSLVPSMLLLVGGSSALFAATADERDIHFETVRELVEAGMRMPAERQIEQFAEAGYPNSSWYEQGLRFAYVDYYRTAAPPDIAGPLEAEYKTLLASLKGAGNQLPDLVKNMVDGAGGADLRRYVNLILTEMNPTAPPPLVKFPEDRQREFTARLKRLLESAEQSLALAMKAVEDYEPTVIKGFDLDPDGKAWQEINQKAILLRYEYAHNFYITYKALREVVQRGEQFGLSKSIARDLIEPWLFKQLNGKMDIFGEWDWNYAELYPLLKHRMAVILSEAVRLSEARPDLGKLGGMSYDDVRGSFYNVIDLDLELFPRQFRDGLTVLKYETWSDLMFWHLAMGTDRSLEEAARMWEDFISRSPDPLNHRDRSRNQAIGNLYILAARIFAAREEMTRANALLVELQRSQNFFAGNARLWLTYLPTLNKTAASGWGSMPSAEDPNIAITLAQQLRFNANQQTDRQVAASMRSDAAVALRNAILGLPSINDPEFLIIAPQLYQAYAYTLFDSDLLYEAVVAAEAGLERFKPLWERTRNQGGNPWRNGDDLSAGGLMVQRLAANLLSYSQRLRSRAANNASRDANRRAIEFLRLFDPEKADDGLDWISYVLALSQGDYQMALDALGRYEEANPNEKIKVMGARARVYYAWLDAERKIGGSKVVSLQPKLDAALLAVRKVVEPYIRQEKEIPEGQASEVKNLWRFLTTVEVASLFTDENYTAVLEKLDLEFWENLQDDRELNRQLFNYLSAAAYKVGVANARDAAKSKDPELMLKLWPLYENAVNVYGRLVAQWPEIDERLQGNRRQIAALMNVVRQQTDWFQDNVEAKKEGFKDYDPDLFSDMTDAAALNFARIYPVTDETEGSTVLSIALAYWYQGDRKSAVPLFERYKKQLSANATLQAFREDPSALMTEVGNRMSERQALRPYWERKGPKSIPDLLVDEPGFAAEMANPNVRQADWSERKRDFVRAMALMKEFGKELQGQKNLISGFDALWEEYEAFNELVQGLAYSVQIDTWLVEAYQKMGRGAEAFIIAGELYGYDPLNPSFMALVIDNTLDRLRAGEKVPEDTIREAQGIAARLRNLSATGQRRDLYWISSIQVMELAFYLDDVASINSILQRQVVDNNLPPADFSVPLSDPWRANDERAVEICSRYLELFALPGVTVEKPYSIEERDGEVLFIREKK